MSTAFNAEEILEMACQIERNGARYYRKAAELSQASDAKDMLIDFADMEDDHEKVFAKMKSKVQATPIPPEDLTPEALRYLHIIADKHVVPKQKRPEDDLSSDASLRDILSVAMDMENNSIMFYLGLMEAMPEEWGQKNVKAIIREEMRHVALISDKISDLAKKG
jgi:rubrerythrin